MNSEESSAKKVGYFTGARLKAQDKIEGTNESASQKLEEPNSISQKMSKLKKLFSEIESKIMTEQNFDPHTVTL